MSQTKAANQSQTDRAAYQADPEVVVRVQRRQFSVAEKVRILAEADACQGAGEIGALLRREGPVGLRAEDEVYRGVDARPVLDGDLQGDPVTAGELHIRPLHWRC